MLKQINIILCLTTEILSRLNENQHEEKVGL